eukprot:s2545_g2.t1
MRFLLQDACALTWGLVHKRVLCYGEWELTTNGQPLRGTLLRENGIRVGHAAPPAWLRAFPTPINSVIGRDLCGEFQLSAGIAVILDTAQGDIVGEVMIFSTSTPCCSCLALLRQMQLRFPGVSVKFRNGEFLQRKRKLNTPAWFLRHSAGSGDALGRFGRRGSFAWQAWHLETLTFTLCGRCGTSGTQLTLLTRLVAFGAAALLRGRRGNSRHRPSLCVAGVALGDIDLHFVWQAWFLRHSAGSGDALGRFGRRGSFAWQAWHFAT